MELLHTEQTKSGRKRMIRMFSGLFIGLLIVFTLLSNTLIALTQPKVISRNESGAAYSYVSR